MTTVRLPPVLRQAAGGAREVEIAGASTVAEALDALYDQHPTLRAQIQADDGGLHRFVNVYLNDEDVRLLSWLDTEVAEGDTLMILPAMAGGSSSRAANRGVGS
jgi:molybdopterin converting factor small subunit